ncbi:helix-turn-helix domain-containing protein [Nocardia asiatica]
MARRGEGENPKVAALREAGCLNLHPEDVTDKAFGSHEFFDARDSVQVKYEMVRRVRVDGDSVAAAAAAFGYTLSSYNEAAAALDELGLEGLAPGGTGQRRKRNLTDEVWAFADQQLYKHSCLRPADLAEPIEARFGLRLHPRAIERGVERYRVRQSPVADSSDCQSPGE